MILTAVYIPINLWGLLGMEVSALTLIVTASVWLALRADVERRFTFWPYVLLGIGTLVRLDMVLPFATIVCFNAAVAREMRRRHVLVGFGILLTFLLAQTLHRFWYFGDVLPNTYYLKLTGYPLTLRIARGLAVTVDFIWRANVLLFLLPIVAVLLGRNRRAALLLALFLMQMLYSVYVGGDAWELGESNRFVTIAMPLFFILFAWSVARLGGWVNARRPHARQVVSAATAVLLMGSVFCFNVLPNQYLVPQWLLLGPAWSAVANHQMIRLSQVIRDVTTPDAVLAVVAAGTLPYFADRPAIDMLGKADRQIAHGPARMLPLPGESIYTSYRPGHHKWDFQHSVVDLQPDVVYQLWLPSASDLAYMEAHYQKVAVLGDSLYLRKDSGNILWDRVGTD